MKQLPLPVPYVSALTPEQEKAALALQDGDAYERTAFRVLALILARQDMTRVEFAATLGLSRQAVHRGFALLRSRGIHDEPKKHLIRNPKGVPIDACVSPRHGAGLVCPACKQKVVGDVHFGVCADECCGAAPCVAKRELRDKRRAERAPYEKPALTVLGAYNKGKF